MDKITEEVITSLIKRIEAIEEKINLVPTKKQNVGTNKRMITPGQQNFIAGLEKSLGLEHEDCSWMTSWEASKHIDKLKAMKDNQQVATETVSHGEGSNALQNQMEDPSKDEVHRSETPSAGTFENKPLTPEEIEEIGEENLL